MTNSHNDDGAERVVILAPTAKDTEIVAGIFARSRVAYTLCKSLPEACRELSVGASAVLLPEEAIAADREDCLTRWLAGQPPWSDLPVLIIARSGADSVSVGQAMDRLGNVTVLERPMRVAALVSAVRTAIRARSRQYQIRDYLVERERSQQADALRAAIVASSDDAIISKNLDGIILTWNAGAQRIFGYTAEEAIGQPITMLIPAERLDEEQDLLTRLRRGERIEHFETVRVTKDGRRLDISLTVSPVRDANDRIFAASKVARDITLHKRAVEDLRAAQEHLKIVTDNMAVAVTHCDRDMRYLWISAGGAEWLGRSQEQIVGRPIPEIIGEQAFATIRPYIERALAGERVTFELPIPYRDLGQRWVKAVYNPTHDPAGNTVGWVAVILDTSDHHRLEEALREADRRKDEFLAILAHELRNPLAPIRNSLHILRLTMSNDPTAERVGQMMERQVNHMVRLVDDLLEISRITRGKIELRKEPVDLAAIVRSAIEASRPLIESARHQLAISVPAEPVMLQADPVRLAQVLANLLNNAAKYTDPGGQIWLTVKRAGNEVAVSVRDTGVGIPADMLPQVFDLFTQVDRAADRAQGGLGIGLTLVRSLVEMHGGSVSARSDGPGQGSEFIVHLPLDQSAETLKPSGPVASASFLPPRRVMVVDDNRDSAESLGMLLRLLGAEVHVHLSGAEALAEMSRFQPSVVLLDIGMPEMDGYEVARRIRANPDLRDVTLIALTGWGQDEDRRRTHSAGFDHHLVKPADMKELESMLASMDKKPDGEHSSVTRARLQ